MAETSFALYRKYRPDSFEKIRNQDHIIRVLKGALEKHMVPHALLFTGSRGTGKTTTARIFAHAVGATDIDIYEIDAASNRGIDDIRALKESVNTLPFESPYKVYIIDEVHMLTKEAWNALLKTLEEPPEHVIFILATTEQDKLPDTIVSRCQIFTFKAPTRSELKATVLDIAQLEKFTLSEAGADTIALAADGSYRDALGITQKVMMASGDATLDPDEIAVIVGAPKRVILYTFIKALHEKNTPVALAALHDASESRVDMRIFLTMFLERVRMIMLLRNKALDARSLESVTDDERTLITLLAHDVTSPINSKLLMRFLEVGNRLGFSSIPELPLELAVIEVTSV